MNTSTYVDICIWYRCLYTDDIMGILVINLPNGKPAWDIWMGNMGHFVVCLMGCGHHNQPTWWPGTMYQWYLPLSDTFPWFVSPRNERLPNALASPQRSSGRRSCISEDVWIKFRIPQRYAIKMFDVLIKFLGSGSAYFAFWHQL